MNVSTAQRVDAPPVIAGAGLELVVPRPPAPSGRSVVALSERALWERHAEQPDPWTRDALVERFLPLARSIARRYENRGEPLEDLVQVASLALVNAVDRFDASRGYAFTSFAVPTIAGEVKRHFRDRGWAVRPPRRLQELSLRVDRATESLTQQLDRAPTVAEIARALDSDEEQVLEALCARAGRNALSLQGPCSTAYVGPVLEGEFGREDDGYRDAESRAVLERLLALLPKRDRDVMRLRYGADMTQAEISAVFGISQMQVSRIVRNAIDRLREIVRQQERLQQAGRGTYTACCSSSSDAPAA
ncbi:MAG: polymerase sigma-B factor [Solirubrobacteraceae bacterium]|nr:polymerase sigma-B factor [Solirubrobacteraceae bacterium]